MNGHATSMRTNPVRQRLRAGGNAFGVMALEFFTPGLDLGWLAPAISPTVAAAPRTSTLSHRNLQSRERVARPRPD
jgi:hypothetical protein